MEGLLAGIHGVEVVIDDIVISATTDDDHLKRLDPVLQRLIDKVSCFWSAPVPRSVGELKSFIGMIQFYSSFAPQLADLAQGFQGQWRDRVSLNGGDERSF